MVTSDNALFIVYVNMWSKDFNKFYLLFLLIYIYIDTVCVKKIYKI